MFEMVIGGDSRHERGGKGREWPFDVRLRCGSWGLYGLSHAFPHSIGGGSNMLFGRHCIGAVALCWPVAVRAMPTQSDPALIKLRAGSDIFFSALAGALRVRDPTRIVRARAC